MSLPPFRLRERLAASRGQPQAYFQGKRQKDLLGKMSAREAQVCDDGRRRRGLGRGAGGDMGGIAQRAFGGGGCVVSRAPCLYAATLACGFLACGLLACGLLVCGLLVC